MGELPLLLTIPQVMAQLQVKSKDTVYALISSGELESTDISATEGKSGRRPRTRVPRSSLERFIASRTTSAPKRAAP